MIPREHGSWAVLIGPIIVGFAAAGGVAIPVAALFFCAALGGFLARVPLESLLSPRPGPAAGAWLAAYSVLAAMGIGPLLFAYGRWGLLAFALPAPVLLLLSFGLIKEVAGILVLCLGAPAAYYAATGSATVSAWLAWTVCGLYFCGPIFHVKLAAHQHRGSNEVPKRASASLAYHGLVTAAVAAAALTGFIPPLLILPFAAAALKTWLRSRRGPGKVDFRRLGYEEVGYAVLFAASAVGGYHG